MKDNVGAHFVNPSFFLSIVFLSMEVSELVLGEGLAENLANSEVVEKGAEVIGAVHDTLREVVKIGTEQVHGVARAMNAAGGGTPKGMPDIKDSADDYVDEIEAKIEGLAASVGETFDKVRESAPDLLEVVDPTGALEETVETLAEQVGEEVAGTVIGTVMECAGEELLETATGSIPVVGAIVPFWSVIHGTAKATAGTCSLLAGGSMALIGGLYGAAAAPFDGGASWGTVMNSSRKPAAWGASMGTEGGLIAVKGAVGFADQVPCNMLSHPY